MKAESEKRHSADQNKLSEESIRVEEKPLAMISEPKKQVPVYHEVDVIVAGGGIAGVFAALAASRNGARTLLIDRFGAPGGNMGPGMIIGGNFDGYSYSKSDPDATVQPDEVPHAETLIIKDPGIYGGYTGIPKEFMERYGAYGGGRLPYREMQYLRDSGIASQVALEMLTEGGVELLLSVFVCDPIMEGNRIVGVYYEGKGGRHAARAKVVVDATGEADVARRAGAPALYPKESYFKWDKHAPSGMGIFAVIGGIEVEEFKRYIRETDKLFEIEPRKIPGLGRAIVVGSKRNPYGKVLYEREGLSGFRVQLLRPHQNIDAGNAIHISRMEAAIRMYIFDVAQTLKENVPGFEESYLMVTSPYLTVRGGPCIEGLTTLTMEDCLAGKKSDDVVYIYGEPRALHRTRQKHGKSRWTDMPYRALIPKRVDGLIAVGRCASGIPDTLVRNRMAVLHMGQVGGTAAALAAKAGVSPAELDVKQLQGTLLDAGFYLGNRERLRELEL